MRVLSMWRMYRTSLILTREIVARCLAALWRRQIKKRIRSLLIKLRFITSIILWWTPAGVWMTTQLGTGGG